MGLKCLVFFILASLLVQNSLGSYFHYPDHERRTDFRSNDFIYSGYDQAKYSRSSSSTTVFNVVRYGARGDGRSDDTQVSIYAFCLETCIININYVTFLSR